MEHSDLDAHDVLQREISALPGVRAARVVATAGGRITEVHVVAESDKAPKQLVRDIQTLALASVGLKIDYRIVSVVQFGERAIPPATTATAPALVSVTWSTDGARSTCGVEVGHDGGLAKGQAAGSAAESARPRIAAHAACDALLEAIQAPNSLDVADVTLVDVASRRVAVVVLVRVTGVAEEHLLGAALVRTDTSEAIARAVLDAYARTIVPM